MLGTWIFGLELQVPIRALGAVRQSQISFRGRPDNATGSLRKMKSSHTGWRTTQTLTPRQALPRRYRL